MKLLKVLLFLFLTNVLNGQVLIENFSLKEVADTIILKSGLKYAIILTAYNPSNDNAPIEFYVYGDSTKKSRSVRPEMVQFIFDHRKERMFVEMKMESFAGKDLYIAAVPFQPAFSKRWKVVVDGGLDAYSGVLSYKGEHLLFKSELAVVNFLISQGWELDRIIEVEKGSVGFGTAIFGSSAIGGSAKISSTNYILKRRL